jgi:hypothetical protein
MPGRLRAGIPRRRGGNARQPEAAAAVAPAQDLHLLSTRPPAPHPLTPPPTHSYEGFNMNGPRPDQIPRDEDIHGADSFQEL